MKIYRKNDLVEYADKKKMLWQWAEEYGLTYNSLAYRLKRGWPLSKALETPARERGYTREYAPRWVLKRDIEETMGIKLTQAEVNGSYISLLHKVANAAKMLRVEFKEVKKHECSDDKR